VTPVEDALVIVARVALRPVVVRPPVDDAFVKINCPFTVRPPVVDALANDAVPSV
jgi:hypothetical protein